MRALKALFKFECMLVGLNDQEVRQVVTCYAEHGWAMAVHIINAIKNRRSR